MATDLSGDASLLIPARLSVGEAQDHRSRLMTLVEEVGTHTIDFSDAEACTWPSAVSLQLCLATAAQLAANGIAPLFGPEAKRLLSAQKLL
jgi:hypothetical protein